MACVGSVVVVLDRREALNGLSSYLYICSKYSKKKLSIGIYIFYISFSFVRNGGK